MTEEIQLGVPTTLIKDTVYALPGKLCKIFVETATPTIVLANQVAMSTTVTLTLDANAQSDLAAAFIKSTGAANIVVCLKPY